MYLRRLVSALIVLLIAGVANAQINVTRGKNLSVDVAGDGRLSMDLYGDIWVLPASGGEATQLTPNLRSATRPRWSPDATQIAYQASASGHQGIWLYEFADGSSTKISESSRLDLQPSWHPSGERIVYASDRTGDGLDIWETDLATGVHWRLTDRAGDETEPAWSSNGRDLVYVHHDGERWSLLLRRFGQPEEVLTTSPYRIQSPAWRPDHSLLTWIQNGDRGRSLQMIILSEPRLIRTYEGQENFDGTAVSWLNRHRMYYSANGYIRQRQFGDWSSSPLRFRAQLQPDPSPAISRDRPDFEWQDEPTGELVIRAWRMFDGITEEYRRNKDILIKGGRIVSIEEQADRADQIVIDLGDLTIIPGLIDADARLPEMLTQSTGPELLGMGITTLVSVHPDSQTLNATWSGKQVPGPRLLSGPDWAIGPLPRPELDVTAAVTTSRSTGQTTGAALPTQFRALRIAGLSPTQTLRAAGVNAAAALQADPYLGRLATGAAADLVFVDGDPLKSADSALNVVAVVRNGRFYSLSGLRDRARAAESVEKINKMSPNSDR